jgi:hypothetical protein
VEPRVEVLKISAVTVTSVTQIVFTKDVKHVDVLTFSYRYRDAWGR